MADIKIAGVGRAGAFSPNHIGNDAAIFNATADHLRKRGCIVNIYSEAQFRQGIAGEDAIISMCREPESIALLQEYEDNGMPVINSGYGISNCTRERMTRILLGNGIPYPESIIVNTDEAVRPELKSHGFGRCWIKRGEFHSMHKEDVSFCRHADEAQEVLQEYFLRGIKRAVINRHLDGDLVKFYGIRGSNFFYWFYPFEVGHSKYGVEAINGHVQNLPFDQEELKRVCLHAAQVMDVVVYGGDAIIDPDGTFKIIDFNDWPSFAPCRNEAAPHIAKVIISLIKEHKATRQRETRQ